MSVKYLLNEANLQRSINHIISMLQNELLPRVLLSIVKGCVFSAVTHKRKLINETDLNVAIQLSEFKWTDTFVVHSNRSFLCAKHFSNSSKIAWTCGKRC